MNRPGQPRSLAARMAQTPHPDRPPDPAERPVTLQSPDGAVPEVSGRRDDQRIDALRRRHCWVLGVEPEPGPWPGLVAEWRRAADGWQARVVYAPGRTPTTVEEWVPAARLRPGSWPG